MENIEKTGASKPRPYNGEAQRRYYAKTKETHKQQRADAQKRHRESCPMVKCQCGVVMKKLSIYGHEKSKGHKKYIEQCEEEGKPYTFSWEVLDIQQPDMEYYKGGRPMCKCDCGVVCRVASYNNHKQGMYHKMYIDKTYPDQPEMADEDLYVIVT